jgi:hypothetical protein
VTRALVAPGGPAVTSSLCGAPDQLRHIGRVISTAKVTLGENPLPHLAMVQHLQTASYPSAEDL